MSKLTVSSGQMYNWVTHLWDALPFCSHLCSYCYVKAFRELKATPELNYPFPLLGKKRKIFVCHMGDLFCDGVPDDMIYRVLDHCGKFENHYIFQTKNPARLLNFREQLQKLSVKRNVGLFDDVTVGDVIGITLGTTIETNRKDLLSALSVAPPPEERAYGISSPALRSLNCKRFLTCEPLLDFDLPEFIKLIKICSPDFINLGADSKNHNIHEPSKDKVNQLIKAIKGMGIEIKIKANLDRILK